MAGILGDITKLIGHRFSVHSYFDQNLSGYALDYHSHPTAELFYVAGGRASYTVLDKGDHAKTERLKSGDMILIDSDCRHKITVERECRGLLVELRALENDDDVLAAIDAYDTLCNCGSLIMAFGKSNYILLNDFLFIKQIILRLQALINTDKLEYVDHYFTEVIISELLLSVNECYKKTYLTNPHITQIVDYIVRQYQEDLSVEKIAAAVNLDPTYMQKLFRKAMGNTLFDYITQYRVSQSIALMRNTNMKFADIAGEAGFNNRQNFYNAFKRFTGYTPKTFKKYLTIPVTAYTREE